MKKTKILKKNYEYKNVFLKGKYYSGKYIECYIKINNNKSLNFIGIAISKKICNSVVRNKIKRLCKENYRLLENNLLTGYSIIFLWKKNISIKNATYYNIKEDILDILKKAKIFIES